MMDRKLSDKDVRRKKTIGYLKVGIPVAAIAVISVILAVAVQPELKADEVDVSEVRGGVLSVSVGATGSVVPFYEETVTSPIVSKILEVYKKTMEVDFRKERRVNINAENSMRKFNKGV